MIKYKKNPKGVATMEARERLIRVYRRVYAMPMLVRALRITDALSTFFVAGVFLYGIGVLLYAGEYLYAVHLCTVAAIPFVAVSLMRLVINSERPYEVFDLAELVPLREKRRKGASFPSRHVFSAFLIGTLWLPYSIPFGIAAIIIGVYLAVERVLLGIHFVKDTAVGAVIGAISGLIGILIL